MNHHFAASWLKSLSSKLDNLVEWTFAAGTQDAGSTHRNLFREFFSAPFQKVLALVDEAKKTEFLGIIERNLYKFEAQTQQFPLGCLCALLEHGKDAPETQLKVGAWLDFLLGRLRHGNIGVRGSGGKDDVMEVIDVVLSPQFQKFVTILGEPLRDRLADGLGEHLPSLDEEKHKKILEAVPAVPIKIEQVVAARTEELNIWLSTAPRFPTTPMALVEILSKLEQPLVKLYTAVKDTSKKESFLVAVALVLQALRTRFRWMCAVEQQLEACGQELQRRLFYVEGQGAVMEMWLSGRLKKYNTEVTTRVHNLVASSISHKEILKSRLLAIFPERSSDPASGWVNLDGPTAVSDCILMWLQECSPGFFCPQHTLARETIAVVLQRFGGMFEIQPGCSRARLQLSPVQISPSVVQPIVTQNMPLQPLTLRPPLQFGALQNLAPGNVYPQNGALVRPVAPLTQGGLSIIRPPPGVVSPVVAAVASAAAATAAASAAAAAAMPVIVPPPPGGQPLALTPTTQPQPLAEEPPLVDNLIDLLMQEEMAAATEENKQYVKKVAHGLYTIRGKEVTLHTLTGRLFVNRVSDVLRHCPVKQYLQEEGILMVPTPPVGSQLGSGIPDPARAVTDTSSVARIALQAAQISSGVTTTTPLHKAIVVFGQQQQQKTDPQALLSKRNEAATRAMDVSKQIVRRTINFEDEKLLRKLMSKGMKHDKQWLEAYQEHCACKNIAPDENLKKLGKDVLAAFIEKHMAGLINEAWAKKVLSHDHEEHKKNKKDKKDKKKKEKKDLKIEDKKRKGSGESTSSEDHGAQPAAGAGAIAQNQQDLAPPNSEALLGGSASMSSPPIQHDPFGMGMMPPFGDPGVTWGLGGLPSMVGPLGMPPWGLAMPGERKRSLPRRSSKKRSGMIGDPMAGILQSAVGMTPGGPGGIASMVGFEQGGSDGRERKKEKASKEDKSKKSRK